ncbi:MULTISPECIES: hypothetical protein [unclassified Curtobacterium]|uniref:hypothetical protein n=1 Tax=unclassified Curtobacterium TaxID=257496 RepID=UPI0039B0F454
MSRNQPTAGTRNTPWNAPIASAPCRTCQTMIPDRTHGRRLRRPMNREPSQSAAMAARTVSAIPDAMLVAGATMSSTMRTIVTTTRATNSSPTTTRSARRAGDRRSTWSGSVGVVSGTAFLQRRNP